MSAESGTVDLGTPLSQSADLDEFLRALKRTSDSVAPQQGADQQSSYLQNTHQGTAGQLPVYSFSSGIGSIQPQISTSGPAETSGLPTSSIALAGGSVARERRGGHGGRHCWVQSTRMPARASPIRSPPIHPAPLRWSETRCASKPAPP